MRLGYNTNGFAHHRLEDAIPILAELGYQSVSITLDYHALNPFDDGFETQKKRIRELLTRHSLHCVIETGSRFLLDPRRKHQPTLLDPDDMQRSIRRDFLIRAISLAEFMEADAVSFWSGALPENGTSADAEKRLIEECRRLLDAARPTNVRLAFEPEPGMLVETMAQFGVLHDQLDDSLFGLTLDVGHVHCLGDGSIESHIGRWKQKLFNVHLEDMKRGVHEHLMFGEGDMDIPAIVTALKDVAYPHGVHVELSRHSHNAVQTAGDAFDCLSALMDGGVSTSS